MRGINGKNGRIELTKNISHKFATKFVTELIELVQFPTWISIDCFGFITDIERELVGFQWASKNSGMILLNEKSKILINNNKTRKQLHDKFSNMTSEEFLTSWFNSHDRISELYRSGKKLFQNIPNFFFRFCSEIDLYTRCVPRTHIVISQ